jgi:CubicO group peptidase (beta-lactamase class C family)
VSRRDWHLKASKARTEQPPWRPSDPKYAKFRSVGSMSWAGIYNTEFWIDPKRHIGVVMMMQALPFYDEGAIRTLRDFEELVYQKVR